MNTDKFKKISLEQSGMVQSSISLSYHDQIDFVPKCKLQIQFKNVVYQTRSKFQEITILDTEGLGRVLVLDGVTMVTEFDEPAYHEMLAHVALMAHPKPSRVLVIGGGDGGTVREILKHPEVEQVHLCEIDEGVVRVCREYMPSVAGALDDSRVKMYFEDGAKFVADRSNAYEVILVDSTDPIGPGQILFQRPFYQDMKQALSKEGIIASQCESIYLHRLVIEGVYDFAKELFPQTGYCYTLVPTYPSGVIGFMLCSLKHDPAKPFNPQRADQLKDLKYYTPDLHQAAFKLPRFAMEYFKNR